MSAAVWTLARRLVPTPLVPLARRILNKLIENKDWTEQEELILHLIIPRQRGSIDVGANVGSYTRILSNLTPFVHAFEPDIETASTLKAVNLSNVTVHNLALSNKNGQITLRVPIIGGQRVVAIAAVLEKAGEAPSKNEAHVDQLVKTITLDEFATQDIGFVKIDVEGHELDVLSGGTKFFSQQKPIVLIEAEDRHKPGSVERVKKFFEGINYSGVFIYNRVARPIHELTGSMTDPREINKPASRRIDQKYVNNFFFFPSKEQANGAILSLNNHFAADATKSKSK